MESPSKWQKMSPDPNGVDLEVNNNYSDSYSEDEAGNFIVEDEENDIIYEPGYDPDQDLQQKRARLDFKLKSTFESIFEKYGKDFDGVGDEIDLFTGEILVDNGHLKEMQDERDAGDKKAGSNLLRALTVEPESVTETSGDEYSIEDEKGGREEVNNAHERTNDQDNAAVMSDGDMEEDDMILRGYDGPNQNPPDHSVAVAATTELKPTQNHTQHDLPYQRSLQSEEEGSVSFPTYNEILRSFGPQVAPQIVNIISRKQGQDDSYIEPAWRVPDLPEIEPRERPALRAFIPEPEIERSPSPDMSESIWALPKGRGWPYRPKGFSKTRSLGNKTLHSDRLHTSDHTVSDSPRIRNAFTEEEDEFLIAKVAEAQHQGLTFWTDAIWKKLESLNPRHSKASWKNRYHSKYFHLWSLEGSSRPDSRGPHHKSREESELKVIRSASCSPHPVSFFQQPSRTREPAQQGLNVISWSDAVATIKSLDPRLHKDLAKDASQFDLTDVRPVDVDEDALKMRSSDLDFSDESNEEPELFAHISSGAQRIAPITVNPAYEFSDEETGSNQISQLKTPQINNEVRKSSKSKSKGGASGKPIYRQKEVRGKLLPEEVDELSFGLGGEDILYVRSQPRNDRQREPQTSIKRRDEQVAIPKTIAISKEMTNVPLDSDHYDEFDELSVEWLQTLPTVYPKKSMVKSEAVPAAGPSDNAKELNIDLFDINLLPETSPRSALDARKKARMNKRFNSSAVIPSTSSQIESSPPVAVEARVRWKSQQIINSFDNGLVPPTSSPMESSPTPRLKRKFADLNEKEITSSTPSCRAGPETKTLVSDAEDMPLQNMINGDITPTRRYPNKKRGGILTPTHSEERKSRTPLLDYTTPTRRDLMRDKKPKDKSHSPGMVKTPGGTFRKCGQNGFLCQKAFCFRCGLGTKHMKS